MENNEEILEINETNETGEETTPEEITGEETGEQLQIPEYVVYDSALSNEVLYEMDLQTEALVNIETMIAESQYTIWEKPIEEYTPTEGILLIIMFILLAGFVFDIIGGILCLK